MTRNLRIEGIATLLSSLSHGGEHAGTVGYLRREKIVQPDGSISEVPIVSGNALRGILRDHAAEVFWASLGRPELPAPVFHLLWSGGALAKAGAGHVLGARQLADVRNLIPVVSLFGGSGAGKIIEGKMRVGKLVPICAETTHLMPDGVGNTRSVWDMLQIEEFTRRDDAKRDRLHAAIEGMGTPVIEAGRTLAVEAQAPAVEGPAQQMRYGVETLAAGSLLHWWITLHGVTDVESALLAQAIEEWSRGGAHIGGRSATGHGRMRLDVQAWQAATQTITVGDALATPDGDVLRDHVTGHRDAIIEALGWFA